MAFASLAWLTLVCACALAVEDSHRKRAPLGFTGVRGKKSIPDSAYAEQDVAPEGDGEVPKTFEPVMDPISGGLAEKRAPSGFMGMRGKKPEDFGGWTPPSPNVGYTGYGDVWLKRAPSGFFGMRGKKDYEDFPKRAPSGFFGMRGKKESIPLGYFGAKRAPMGFVGMRGKKSGIDEDKRAPSGFFGMRGKKPSGFFGMRGKKYPFEFRGKFVGVRGKKTSNAVTRPGYDLDLDRLGNELDINQLMLLLTEQKESDLDNEWNSIDDGLISQ